MSLARNLSLTHTSHGYICVFQRACCSLGSGAAGAHLPGPCAPENETAFGRCKFSVWLNTPTLAISCGTFKRRPSDAVIRPSSGTCLFGVWKGNHRDEGRVFCLLDGRGHLSCRSTRSPGIELHTQMPKCCKQRFDKHCLRN